MVRRWARIVGERSNAGIRDCRLRLRIGHAGPGLEKRNRHSSARRNSAGFPSGRDREPACFHGRVFVWCPARPRSRGGAATAGCNRGGRLPRGSSQPSSTSHPHRMAMEQVASIDLDRGFKSIAGTWVALGQVEIGERNSSAWPGVETPLDATLPAFDIEHGNSPFLECGKPLRLAWSISVSLRTAFQHVASRPKASGCGEGSPIRCRVDSCGFQPD